MDWAQCMAKDGTRIARFSAYSLLLSDFARFPAA